MSITFVDEILQLALAELLGPFAKNKEHGINDVGLSTSIRANNRRKVLKCHEHKFYLKFKNLVERTNFLHAKVRLEVLHLHGSNHKSPIMANRDRFTLLCGTGRCRHY